MYLIWPVEWAGEQLGGECLTRSRRTGVSNRSGLGLGELTSICSVLAPSSLPRSEPRNAARSLPVRIPNTVDKLSEPMKVPNSISKGTHHLIADGYPSNPEGGYAVSPLPLSVLCSS